MRLFAGLLLVLLHADSALSAELCIDLFTVTLNRAAQAKGTKTTIFDIHDKPPGKARTISITFEKPPGKKIGIVELGCGLQTSDAPDSDVRPILRAFVLRWKTLGQSGTVFPLCQGDVLTISEQSCPVQKLNLQRK
jgi:hypothetical protein